MSANNQGKPWKVRKAGTQISEHKHFGPAQQAAIESGATSVYYWNGTLGTTVWEAPQQELTYR